MKAWDKDEARRLVEVSLLVYRDPATWAQHLAPLGLRLLAVFDGEVTQGCVAGDGHGQVLAFRGTEFDEPADLLTNARLRLVPGPYGRVHRGTAQALDAVWPAVAAALDGEAPLWITGHSLGGAMALLAAARVAAARVQAVHLFGAPRLGDADFAQACEAALGPRTWRYTNHHDVVPRLMGPPLPFRHVGREVYFDGDGQVHVMAPGASAPEGKGVDGLADHLVPRYAEVLRGA